MNQGLGSLEFIYKKKIFPGSIKSNLDETESIKSQRKKKFFLVTNLVTGCKSDLFLAVTGLRFYPEQYT